MRSIISKFALMVSSRREPAAVRQVGSEEKRTDFLDLADNLSFRVVIAIAGIFAIASHFLRLLTERDTYPVLNFSRGGDFIDFHIAAQNLAHGMDPYRISPYYNKPPLFTAILLASQNVEPWLVTRIFQVSVAIVVLWVIVIAAREARQGFWVIAGLASLMLFSYPFQFLMDRGNLDGHALAFGFLAFFLARRGRLIWGGLALAIGVGFKTNAVMLAPAFVLQQPPGRRWQTLAVVLATLAATFALTPSLIPSFIATALERGTSAAQYLENGSIFRVFAGLPRGDAVSILIVVSFLIVVTRSLYMKRQPIVGDGAYDGFWLSLPLCSAVPKQTFTYGLVFLPLTILFYASLISAQTRQERVKRFAYLGCAGILLVVFPSALTMKMLSKGQGEPSWPFFVNAFGALLMMVANAGLALQSMRSVCPSPVYPGVSLTAFSRTEKGMLVLVCIIGGILTGHFLATGDRRLFAAGQFAYKQTPEFYPGAEFKIGQHDQGWGTLRNGKSVSGNPLRIGGQEFQEGLGTHTDSSIEVVLPDGATTMSGGFGIDDESGEHAAGLQFLVKNGATELFRSEPLKPPGRVNWFRVDVRGLRSITLHAVSLSGNHYFNHADWVQLRVESSSSR